MDTESEPKRGTTTPSASVRELANQAFSRTAGARLVGGNSVRLLRDARENYPAWLDAIAAARRHVYFENYIIHDDEAGEALADALLRKASEGVSVRLLHDWLGAVGKTSHSFWTRLRAGGVDVRTYNPPRLDAPLAWLSRDHRKMISVDGEVGFVTGLCVGAMWVGRPEQDVAPWRDTGVEIRGPAVAEIERAFRDVWASLGEPIPDDQLPATVAAVAGDVSLRVVATVPGMGGLFRLDQLVASLATRRLWLTDAYYAGTAAYVQALRAAAADGVDVRLLVPNATDLPMLQPLSRAGYRTLLRAGVRVFEWNGTMLHAKTAVADGRWARVGSTNLNLASWLGNCELDAVIEDEAFATKMEEMYLDDLANATEVVLDAKCRMSRPRRSGGPRPRHGAGSATRTAAGAIRIGNAMGAAFTRQRVLEPVEARIMLSAGAILVPLSILFILFPWLLVYPVVAGLLWIAGALIWTGLRLLRQSRE